MECGRVFFSFFALFSFTVLEVRKAVRIALKREESSCSFSVNLTCPVKWSQKGFEKEWLVLFQPRRTVPAWHFQLDVELLECLFQLLLISSIVCSDGIVEQDELIMQNFHLRQQERQRDTIS